MFKPAFSHFRPDLPRRLGRLAAASALWLALAAPAKACDHLHMNYSAHRN